jgi:hypothetical protein
MAIYFRSTENFDPVSHLITINQNTDRQCLYLETQWRVQWFNTFCQEHNLNAVIDDSSIQLVGTSPLQMWYAVAVIFINGEEVSRSASTARFVDPETGYLDPWAAQTAATSAKGRALANLGFSTAGAIDLMNQTQAAPPESSVPYTYYAPEDGRAEYTGYNLADAGVRFPQPAPVQQPYGAVPQTNNPMPPTDAVSTPAPVSVMEPRQTSLFPQMPAQTPVQAPVQEPAQPQAISASDVVIPGNGKYSGKTVGEVYACDPGYVAWALSSESYCKRFPDVVRALQALQNERGC